MRGRATGPNCLARSSHIRLHRYQARGTGGFRTTEQNSFGTLNVFLNNQFGPSTTQFTNQPFITQYDELCMPATLS
jgi:hypothetical protein